MFCLEGYALNSTCQLNKEKHIFEEYVRGFYQSTKKKHSLFEDYVHGFHHEYRGISLGKPRN